MRDPSVLGYCAETSRACMMSERSDADIDCGLFECGDDGYCVHRKPCPEPIVRCGGG